MLKEIFKNIPNFEGLYQASNLGRLKNLKTGLFLSGCFDKNGYRKTILRKNNKRYYFRIHRLILYAFKGKSNLQCNHKNGIKIDNRLENLEYCTNSENIKHAFRIGLKTQKGEKNNCAKLTNLQALEIKTKYNLTLFKKRGDKIKFIKKLMNKYNVKFSTINNIISGRQWRYLLYG